MFKYELDQVVYYKSMGVVKAFTILGRTYADNKHGHVITYSIRERSDQIPIMLLECHLFATEQEAQETEV